MDRTYTLYKLEVKRNEFKGHPYVYAHYHHMVAQHMHIQHAYAYVSVPVLYVYNLDPPELHFVFPSYTTSKNFISA